MHLTLLPNRGRSEVVQTLRWLHTNPLSVIPRAMNDAPSPSGPLGAWIGGPLARTMNALSLVDPSAARSFRRQERPKASAVLLTWATAFDAKHPHAQVLGPGS